MAALGRGGRRDVGRRDVRGLGVRVRRLGPLELRGQRRYRTGRRHRRPWVGIGGRGQRCPHQLALAGLLRRCFRRARRCLFRSRGRSRGRSRSCGRADLRGRPRRPRRAVGRLRFGPPRVRIRVRHLVTQPLARALPGLVLRLVPGAAAEDSIARSRPAGLPGSSKAAPDPAARLAAPELPYRSGLFASRAAVDPEPAPLSAGFGPSSSTPDAPSDPPPPRTRLPRRRRLRPPPRTRGCPRCPACTRRGAAARG